MIRHLRLDLAAALPSCQQARMFIASRPGHLLLITLTFCIGCMNMVYKRGCTSVAVQERLYKCGCMSVAVQAWLYERGCTSMAV